jgi:HlyD family secretion protein
MWLAAVGLGASIALLAVWALRPTTDVRVDTAPVTVGPIARRIVASGTLQAVATVEVGTQVSGIVASLEADYNSIVRQGQVLARLDPSSYDAQLRQEQAALAQAEADAAGFRTALADAQT